MTTLTLVGPVTDRFGHSETRSYQWEGKAAVEYRTIEAIPSVEYRSVHPGPIAVRRGHEGADVGRCLHLERSADDAIVAVAQVDDCDDLLAPLNGPLYWSPELRFRRDRSDGIQITELAITRNPATFALTPLDIIFGDVKAAGDYVRCRRRPHLAALLDRAHAATTRRPFCGPVVVEDPTALKVERLPTGDYINGRGDPIPVVSEERQANDRRPLPRLIDGRMVPLEYRVGKILSVGGRPVR